MDRISLEPGSVARQLNGVNSAKAGRVLGAVRPTMDGVGSVWLMFAVGRNEKRQEMIPALAEQNLGRDVGC
jgi:hypothetical protein